MGLRLTSILALFAIACASTAAHRGRCDRGEISYYAKRFDGRKTANGEIYDHDALTAAHRTFAFGTRLRVTLGDKHVDVRVNDRGPYAKHRILDVSGRAAKILNLETKGHGVAEVCVTSR